MTAPQCTQTMPGACASLSSTSEAALVYGFLGVFLGVFLPRAAQILKQALLDLAASEIRRGCHVYLLRPGRRNQA